MLDGFHRSEGVRMTFSLVEVPEQEDWGTADSLRTLRGRVKVHVCATMASASQDLHPYDCEGVPLPPE